MSEPAQKTFQLSYTQDTMMSSFIQQCKIQFVMNNFLLCVKALKG